MPRRRRSARYNKPNVSPVCLETILIKNEPIEEQIPKQKQPKHDSLILVDSDEDNDSEQLLRILTENSNPPIPSTSNNSNINLENSVSTIDNSDVMQFVSDLLVDEEEEIRKEVEESHKRDFERHFAFEDDVYQSHSQGEIITIDESIVEIQDSPPPPVQWQPPSPPVQWQPPSPPKVNESEKPERQSCPVCFEELHPLKLSITFCGHVFCTECITSAIVKTKKCPTCREKLTLKKLVKRVYFQF